MEWFWNADFNDRSRFHMNFRDGKRSQCTVICRLNKEKKLSEIKFTRHCASDDDPYEHVLEWRNGLWKGKKVHLDPQAQNQELPLSRDEEKLSMAFVRATFILHVTNHPRLGPHMGNLCDDIKPILLAYEKPS